jgi:hypothetical protein
MMSLHRLYRIPGILLAGIVASLPATALAGRNYQVDLIVFSQAATDSENAEQWLDAPPPLDPVIMSSAVTPEQLTAENRPGPDQLPAAENPAEDREIDFADVLARMERNPHRRVLLTASWVQFVQDPDSTPIIHITDRAREADRRPDYGTMQRQEQRAAALQSMPATESGWFQQPPLIDGFVRFYLSGYYTLELDLRYTPEVPFLEQNDPENPELVSYRIHEKRRMKSDELNYYDHPKFGVLLLVNPAPTTEAAQTP